MTNVHGEGQSRKPGLPEFTGGRAAGDGSDIEIVIEKEGSGDEARIVGRAGVFEMSVWESFDDRVPRIRDVDAAVALGFKRPRAIRQLIDRTFALGMRPRERHTVWRSQTPTGGVREHEADEYWLTRAELLKVIARSRTPVADAILDQMIDVFEAFLDGLRTRPMSDAEILRFLFDHCLEPEFKKHETRFPTEFFKAVFWARGVPWPKGLEKGTPLGYPWLGNVIAYIIYYRLPGGRALLGELRRRNPRDENGERRHRAHTGLTPEMAAELEALVKFATQALQGFKNRWNDFVQFWDGVRPEIGVTTAWLPTSIPSLLPPHRPLRSRRRPRPGKATGSEGA